MQMPALSRYLPAQLRRQIEDSIGFYPKNGYVRNLFDRWSWSKNLNAINQFVYLHQVHQTTLELSPQQQFYLTSLKAHLKIERQIVLIKQFKEQISRGGLPSFAQNSLSISHTDGAIICYGCSWPKNFPILIEIRDEELLQKLRAGEVNSICAPEIVRELAHIRCRQTNHLKALVEVVARLASFALVYLVTPPRQRLPFGVVRVLLSAALGLTDYFLSILFTACAVNIISRREELFARRASANVQVLPNLYPRIINSEEGDQTPICPITLEAIPPHERAYSLHFNQSGQPAMTAYSKVAITKWLAHRPIDPQTNQTLQTLVDHRGRVLYMAPF